jgi:hypothetical protein
MVAMDFYFTMLVTAIVPLMLIGLLSIGLFLPLIIADRFDMSDDNAKRDQRSIYRCKSIKLILFALFLVYPSVSANVISMFVCQLIDGKSLMLADLTLECGDPRWMQYLYPAIAIIVVYPIGIPSFFLGVLMYNRKELQSNPRVMLALGFLYEGMHSRQHSYGS